MTDKTVSQYNQYELVMITMEYAGASVIEYGTISFSEMYLNFILIVFIVSLNMN